MKEKRHYPENSISITIISNNYVRLLKMVMLIMMTKVPLTKMVKLMTTYQHHIITQCRQ